MNKKILSGIITAGIFILLSTFAFASLDIYINDTGDIALNGDSPSDGESVADYDWLLHSPGLGRLANYSNTRAESGILSLKVVGINGFGFNTRFNHSNSTPLNNSFVNLSAFINNDNSAFVYFKIGNDSATSPYYSTIGMDFKSGNCFEYNAVGKLNEKAIGVIPIDDKWYSASVIYNKTNFTCSIWNDTNSYSVIRPIVNFGEKPIKIFTGTDGGSGVTYFDDILVIGDNSLYPTKINISSVVYPLDNTQFNHSNIINLNSTVNSSLDFNCSVILNSTRNQSATYLAGTNIDVNFDITMLDGDYEFYFSCYNASNLTDQVTNTTTHYFFVDTVIPSIDTNFTDGGLYYITNITGQFNLSDNLMLHSVNTTLDSVEIFSRWDLNVSFYQYNLSKDPRELSGGNHTLQIRFADGHTANELGGDYYVSNGIFNDYLKFRFWDEGYVKISSKTSSIFDSWKAQRKNDRYSFEYKPSSPKAIQVFVIESSEKIYPKQFKDSYDGSWLIIGNHWLDFVNSNEANAKVSIKKITDYKVEVTVDGLKNPEVQNYNSIGDLNIVVQNYTFAVVNASETYATHIPNNFSTLLTLDLIGTNGYTPDVILEYNASNYTVNLALLNSTHARYNITMPVFWNLNNKGATNHSWHFNLTEQIYENTTTQLQQIYNVEVNNCSGNSTYPILNLTYFDETDNLPITLNNSYNLAIYDGTYYYNQTGSFITDKTTDTFCTNIPPINMTYNWNMWGTFILSKPNYITRVYDVNDGVPYTISNNPTYNLSLYLIKINESSTIKFNWYTTTFQLIDGTMRIYKCNLDGTKSIVESIPIIAGVATANLELLTQTYSYDIIIDGVIYENPNGYSKCHVESETEVTYFVDIGYIDVTPLIGLGAIPCSLENTSNNTVKMEWGANPNKEGYVSGCIIGYRQSIYGNIEIYNNCSVEADGYSREVSIPMSGYTYTIIGKLQQGNYTVICGDEVIFHTVTTSAAMFGISALFGAFLLIASLILFYAGDGEATLVGAAAGIVISYIIGIFLFGFIIVTAAITFLIIIVLIGRYTRK